LNKLLIHEIQLIPPLIIIFIFLLRFPHPAGIGE
jgi:hypothetical protein